MGGGANGVARMELGAGRGGGSGRVGAGGTTGLGSAGGGTVGVRELGESARRLGGGFDGGFGFGVVFVGAGRNCWGFGGGRGRRQGLLTGRVFGRGGKERMCEMSKQEVQCATFAIVNLTGAFY